MSYSTGQTWAALRKTWKAYLIAKAQNDQPAMLKYAERVRTLQKQLGLPLSKFPNVGLG
ncbi:MAG TPA: hypothetical protein VLU99_00230 [Nitrososphaerales archaeon]|nr:hypothetical protein [Nitrososphaerales archaeon]HUK74187.1 hypothetical protein [Nitrososphaerales archaeon]